MGRDIMYLYKQLTDSKNINMLKKAYGKFLIPLIVSMVSIANIVLILLFYLAAKDMFLKISYLIYTPSFNCTTDNFRGNYIWQVYK